MSTPQTIDPKPRDVYNLHAMEIWGGNHACEEHAAVPGFDVYSYAQPHEGSAAGGDLRFVSTCAAGMIVRFTLADVAGHGDSASAVALRLRSLMRKHMNMPNPTKFARALNSEFNKLAAEGRFATAVITTYFAPTDHLIVCNAGHPRPLLYHAASGAWELFDEKSPCVVAAAKAKQTGISNLPLGIIDPTNYPQFATRLLPGDILLSYTDALIEASGRDGEQLGESGLLTMARRLDVSRPAGIGPALLEAIAAYRGGTPANDDVTLMVLHHNGTNPPPMPLTDRLRVMLGLAKEGREGRALITPRA